LKLDARTIYENICGHLNKLKTFVSITSQCVFRGNGLNVWQCQLTELSPSIGECNTTFMPQVPDSSE
jgi:hypothetical protein